MTAEIIYQVVIALLFVVLAIQGIVAGRAGDLADEVLWLRRRLREIHDAGLGVKLTREEGFDVDE